MERIFQSSLIAFMKGHCGRDTSIVMRSCPFPLKTKPGEPYCSIWGGCNKREVEEQKQTGIAGRRLGSGELELGERVKTSFEPDQGGDSQ